MLDDNKKDLTVIYVITTMEYLNIIKVTMVFNLRINFLCFKRNYTLENRATYLEILALNVWLSRLQETKHVKGSET